MERVYLDWNATTPLHPDVKAAMIAAMDIVGNPSSVHAEGRQSKAIMERARVQVAEAVGAKKDEIYFTSGATEAAGILQHFEPIVDEKAHDCLWEHRNATGGNGSIHASGVANSETGIVSGASASGVNLLDAVQAFGKIPFAFGWSDATFALLSAHKIQGPKGVGALLVQDGFDFEPLQMGGGQEQSKRSGTENLIGIAGFGAAAELAAKRLADGEWEPVQKMRDLLEALVADIAPDTTFVGQDVERLPNTTCFATPGWKGETQVMQMDLSGFAISAGSACSSGKVKQSRVLKAMGFDDVTASSAVRVSLGPDTKEEEIERFVATWGAAYKKFKAKAA